MGHSNRTFSTKAKRENLLGTVCCNCGKECGERIEYHHVVPLEYGGHDVIGNLVPLCEECHSFVTFGFKHKHAENSGRKRKEYSPELLDRVFRQYVNKQLTETEARKALRTGQKIKEMSAFKEWAAENGVDPTQRFGRAGRWYK